MNNRFLTGIIIGGTILSTTASAFAFGPQNGSSVGLNGGMGEQNPDRAAMIEAMENNDYQAWYDLTKDSPRGEEILNVINEGNFDRFVEAHKLREAGDFEGSKVIMKELGLPEMGPKKGQGGMMKGMKEVMETIESGDFDAFVELIKDKPMAENVLAIVNESNFYLLQQIQELAKAGNFTEAKAIANELGLDGKLFMKGMHKRMNNAGVSDNLDQEAGLRV